MKKRYCLVKEVVSKFPKLEVGFVYPNVKDEKTAIKYIFEDIGKDKVEYADVQEYREVYYKLLFGKELVFKIKVCND